MRFTVEGVQKECATTRTADPEKWCSKTNREDGRTETTKSLNTLVNFARNGGQLALEWGCQFDAESVVTFRHNRVVNISGISSLFTDYGLFLGLL